MPELPDLTVYAQCLRRRVIGETLLALRIAGPHLLRTYDPPIVAAHGRRVQAVSRLGKRLVLELDDDLYLVLHLMVSGRLRWRPAATKLPARVGSAAFDFPAGTLILTEAGSRKRASLHLVRGTAALAELDPGGLEIIGSDLAAFTRVVRSANHTLKRFLCSPRLLAAVGNAYSDEILHHAQLSPLQWTSRLSDREIGTLHHSTITVLTEWTERLSTEVGDGFPEKVTAFRPGMAVHGRFGKPCPRCGAAVQRILYATRETNYCARCQTDGQVFADRVLSQLLKNDWPRSLEEWEQIRGSAGRP